MPDTSRQRHGVGTSGPQRALRATPPARRNPIARRNPVPSMPGLSVPRLRRRRRSRSLGQSLAEVAVTLPVVILILLISLDFGRVFLGWVNLNNAVRVAANFAAQYPDAWDAVNPNPAQQAQYAALVANDAAAINCTLPSPLPAPNFPSGRSIGNPATVSITCQFQLITPIIGNIVGNPLSVSAGAAFPIRAGTINGVPVGTLPPTPSPTPTPTPTPTATPTPTPTPTGTGPTPTPTTTPTPTPTPVPTPTPTPMCKVPDFKNDDTSTAQATWAGAGFTTNVIFKPLVPPDYSIFSQSISKNSSEPCGTTQITVAAK